MRCTGPVFALLVTVSTAHADPLKGDVGNRASLDDRVQDALTSLRAQGLVARPQERRFAFAGDVVEVPLGLRAAGSPCITVAVLGAPGLSYRLELVEAPAVSAPGAPPLDVEASEEGSALVAFCGEAAARAVVRVGAGRGALLPIVADGAREASRRGWSESASGAPAEEFGDFRLARRRRTPSVERRARFVDEATREGATEVHAVWTTHLVARAWRSIPLDLSRGCHRLMAIADRDDAAVDLDGEIVDTETGLVRAGDDSAAATARLELCVVRDRRVEVRLRALHHDETARVHHAVWPLPADLSGDVDERLATDVAEALRHSTARGAFRVLVSARGGGGQTMVPTPSLAPGCYVAVAAPVAGRASALRLDFGLGGVAASSRKARSDAVTLASVCAREGAAGRLTVEASGSAMLSWALWILSASEGTR